MINFTVVLLILNTALCVLIGLVAPCLNLLAITPTAEPRQGRIQMENARTTEDKLFSLRQTHQLMATLATNLDWSRIPSAAIQELVRDPERAGELLTAFLAQGLGAVVAQEPCSRKSLSFSPHWHRDGSVVYAKMVSTGWTADEWMVWFEENGIRFLESSDKVLCSGQFNPTPAGTVRKIAIVTSGGYELNDWTLSNATKYAGQCGFGNSDLETICLFRKSFSLKEMNAMNGAASWFVATHEPIGEARRQLITGTAENGRWIASAGAMPNGTWPFYSSFIYNRN